MIGQNSIILTCDWCRELDMDTSWDDDWDEDNVTTTASPGVEEKLNYSCRFLSFIDTEVVKPVYFNR